MAPAQLSRQCSDNLRIGKRLRELHHAAKVLLSKTAAELRLQLCGQCPHNLRTVIRPLSFGRLVERLLRTHSGGTEDR